MSTITKNAYISENHKLHIDIDLPENTPTGAVVVTMQISPEPDGELRRFLDSPLFGMWADRDDMANPSEWVRSLRQPRNFDVPETEGSR